MATRTIHIVKGPNNGDLSKIVFDLKPFGKRGPERRPINFTLEDGTYFEFKLLGMDWSDHVAPFLWKLRGIIMSPVPLDWEHEANDIVELHWDATMRCGYIDVQIED